MPIRPAPSLSPRWPGSWSLALLLPGGIALLVQAVRALLSRQRVASRPRVLGFDDLAEDAHARLSGLEQIFREAVAPRLGVGSAAVHGEDLVRLDTFAEEAQAVYRLIERARYAEGGSDEVGAVQALERAMRAFIGKLK